MTREEFADAFETLAKICREPKNPVHSSPYRIKRAVLASAYFGIHGLQTVLCVKSDGILGPITWEALEDINIDVLVAKILAHLIQHPMPSPVGIPPVGVPPVDPFPTPIPEPFPRHRYPMLLNMPNISVVWSSIAIDCQRYRVSRIRYNKGCLDIKL
jgi:hypothetical protein